MNKKVYFAGSIRGGVADAKLYQNIIQYIKKSDTVLTEHVGDLNKTHTKEMGKKADAEIYAQDMTWLNSCDLVIAECTTPSLGVGYELGYAEAHNKPVFIFYRKSKTELSAMLTGNNYFTINRYETFDEICKIIDSILGN